MSAARAVRSVIEERGWTCGSSLEDRAALFLSRAHWTPAEVAQQHPVGPYRLDFAWVDVQLALEVDGFRHLYDPQTARRDAERDAALRADGWVVLRADDAHGHDAFEEQLARVSQIAYLLTGKR